jgi:hypothetical protein
MTPSSRSRISADSAFRARPMSAKAARFFSNSA